MIPVVFAAVAAAAYGVSDYLGGIATRRRSALAVIAVSYPVSVVLSALVALAVGGHSTTAGLLWGAAAGVASGGAVWSFYAALAAGPMSVVSPLTAVLVAALPMAVGLLTGERPGGLALVGVVLAVVATVLVSLEGPDEVESGTGLETPGTERRRFTPWVAVLTVVSGVLFALYFVLLGQVGPGEGLWPVLASRIGATVVVVVTVLARRERIGRDRRLLAVGALIAVVDVVANVAFYEATQRGLLSVVSVVAAMYPAMTVVLALTHGGERVRAVQVVGLVLAVPAVALATLG